MENVLTPTIHEEDFSNVLTSFFSAETVAGNNLYSVAVTVTSTLMSLYNKDFVNAGTDYSNPQAFITNVITNFPEWATIYYRMFILVAQSISELFSYCGLTSYVVDYNATVLAMAVEKYNKSNSNGVSSRKVAGISEDYTSNYSEATLQMMNSIKTSFERKAKFV